jgi:hypothetical protein
MKKYLMIPFFLLIFLLASCGNTTVEEPDTNRSDNGIVDDNQEEESFFITIIFSEALEDVLFFDENNQSLNFTSSDNTSYTLDATNLSSIRFESETANFQETSITLTESDTYYIDILAPLLNDYDRVTGLIEQGETFITLESDLTGDITLDSVVQFDLNGFTFNGDLTFDFTVGIYSISNGVFNGTITVNEYIQNFAFDGTGDLELLLNARVLSLSVPENTVITLASPETNYSISQDLESIIISASNIKLNFALAINIDRLEILEGVENTSIFMSHVINTLVSNGTGTTMNSAVSNTSGTESITPIPAVIVSTTTQSRNIANGALKEEMVEQLTDTAMVTLDNGLSLFLNVTWDEGSNYDPDNTLASNVLFGGDFELIEGVVNSSNIRAAFLFRVQAAETSE